MNLEVRSQNWKTIKKNGATLLWEPFMIDIAISWPEEFDNPSSLQKNSTFLIKCREKASPLRQYSEHDWSTLQVEKDTRSGVFFFNFLRRAASQVANRLGGIQLNALVFEEISSVVLAEIAGAVHDFRPGFKRGAVEKTWGFEAYLQNYSIKSASQSARKVLGIPHPSRKKGARYISIDGSDMCQELGNLKILEKTHPEIFATPAKVLPPFREEECGAIMTEAVKESVAGTPEATVYLLHAVEGRTIRETSKILSISRGKCHRMAEKAAQRVWGSLDSKLREIGLA